ncbi:hypothetical protein NDU88_011290 [Pleurodeles waltl]|uniref:Uncharacterized protein n=1 Tax=Pleurodeles waltl TaxID=8319 RepID=A0AAV7QY76_PLEWA|nr:hypothetical protein NDU88_011290 [Pleurodeles waltl]
MLRMDAMDQVIASLKASPSSPGGGGPCVQEDGPRRAEVPPREAFPPAPKRMRGQKKGKCAGEKRAEATPVQVWDGVYLPLTQSEVSASPVVGTGQPWSGSLGQVSAQTASFVVGSVNTVTGRDTGASSERETSQRDLVGHLASVLP